MITGFDDDTCGFTLFLCNSMFFWQFLDFLAKHLAYLYDFTFLRTITQM